MIKVELKVKKILSSAEYTDDNYSNFIVRSSTRRGVGNERGMMAKLDSMLVAVPPYGGNENSRSFTDAFCLI